MWLSLSLGCLAVQLAIVAVLADGAREARGPVAAALLAPAAALVFVYACARSILLTYARGGIVWRGTFYPLAELRRNEV